MNKYLMYSISVLLRIALIFYGDYQDQNSRVKYTDIDYNVYTEGAQYVVNGQSPYLRHTYRYTPILAFMMIPNVTFHHLFGKFLFAFVDILCGVLIQVILKKTTKHSDSFIAKLTMIFLLNPVIFNVSTRGSADSIIIFLILLTVYLLLNNQIVLGGIIYGAAVHFRIYPIIYCLPLYLYIDRNQPNKEKGVLAIIKRFFSFNRLVFTAISGGLFIFSVYFFYKVYGYQFFFETYEYHIARKDNRHNFSVYFYLIYLHFENLNKVLSTLSFQPQVCTAQYFIWYLSLLPLILANSELFKPQQSSKRLYIMGVVWLVTELLWNLGSFKLEQEGKQVFYYIWISCLTFFIVNLYVIYTFLTSQNVKEFTICEEENYEKDQKYEEVPKNE